MESAAIALYLNKSARGAQKRREILGATLQAINTGTITFADISHDLAAKVRFSTQVTAYYPQSQLTPWVAYMPPQGSLAVRTEVSVLEMSTLEGARILIDALSSHSRSFGRIVILNFANPVKAYGRLIWGARPRRVYPLYSLHHQDDQYKFYHHAIPFTPSAVVLRNDAEEWVSPFDGGALENRILEVVKERMTRILFLFEQLGSKNIVLGSFGTGAFRNSVESVARIRAEMLVREMVRFARSFNRVVFAILGNDTVNT
ncbi:uncharacterized protein EDB91DRAFT_1148255 [Suillus paluster]|uniref:uncharacterized protein n=1 Tax=Suillus paluster TaxID=48578 RepID=UPI001B87E3E5|nr:uncharacterized protein EDB91DRAFT_1148255 [Suillus paluster]KAG1733593.1 hypothetical protein EDB91DRAFT_1148255 [Suillus paluster]